MNYQQFPQDVNAGERILLDDGKLMCEVLETNKKDTVVTKVIQGGPLKSKKGVNLPNTKVSLPCLTKKDLEDVVVAMEEGVEWIGLSFVRDAADVQELRKVINDFGSFAKIVSKIVLKDNDSFGLLTNNKDKFIFSGKTIKSVSFEIFRKTSLVK